MNYQCPSAHLSLPAQPSSLRPVVMLNIVELRVKQFTEYDTVIYSMSYSV